MTRHVTYSDDEKQIVRNGFESIYKVLMGTDDAAKARLLFCLDWFMDPYYGVRGEIESFLEQLKDLLQVVAVTTADKDIAEDALDLLYMYTAGPYEILKKNIDKIPHECRRFGIAVANEEDYDE